MMVIAALEVREVVLTVVVMVAMIIVDGSSYTASFGLITGRHPITVPGTKNINSVDLSAVINNIIHHEGARNNMYLDTANNVRVGVTGTGWQCLATAGISAEGKRTFR